jgi:hypothetical protein
MEGLGDTLGQQQRLADDTFRELQEQFDRDGRDEQRDGQDDGRDGQRDDPLPGEQGSRPTLEELAQRQQALRDRLREEQLGGFPGEDTPEGEAGLQALEEAERAMDEAARALRDGESRRALERQAEAMDALREGIRQLREGSAQDRAEREDPGQGQDARGAGRDPLGREQGDSRLGAERGTGLPGEDSRARARELMDEIRRRLAERERPEQERDYLDRLIERF